MAIFMYSPFLFNIRRDLEQPADGLRQPPLPPPGLPGIEIRKKKSKTEEMTVTAKKSQKSDSLPILYPLPAPRPFPPPPAPCSAASSSSPGLGRPVRGTTLLRTFVGRRKYRIALVHRSSANRSRTVNWLLPLLGSFRSPAHGIFCCSFHCLQRLSRCSRVPVLY